MFKKIQKRLYAPQAKKISKTFEQELYDFQIKTIKILQEEAKAKQTPFRQAISGDFPPVNIYLDNKTEEIDNILGKLTITYDKNLTVKDCSHVEILELGKSLLGVYSYCPICDEFLFAVYERPDNLIKIPPASFRRYMEAKKVIDQLETEKDVF